MATTKENPKSENLKKALTIVGDVTEPKETLTPELLASKVMTVADTLEFANTFRLPTPNMPRKPRLNPTHTATEAREYADALETYNAEMVVYNESMQIARQHNSRIGVICELYIKERAGLFSIPEQYRDKVYSKAWQDGHSSGLNEVFNQLLELVEIFE